MKEKKNKEHEAAQKAQSLKQLEEAKRANIEKMVCFCPRDSGPKVLSNIMPINRSSHTL